MDVVKIRTLSAPRVESGSFDPGEFLGELEFYETDDAITDEERDALAQLIHLLAFLALQTSSSRWRGSTVGQDTLAFRALESHFGHLDGWGELSEIAWGLSYGGLVRFLMTPYPPHVLICEPSQ